VFSVGEAVFSTIVVDFATLTFMEAKKMGF
jgi:hypothetical protein